MPVRDPTVAALAQHKGLIPGIDDNEVVAQSMHLDKAPIVRHWLYSGAPLWGSTLGIRSDWPVLRAMGANSRHAKGLGNTEAHLKVSTFVQPNFSVKREQKSLNARDRRKWNLIAAMSSCGARIDQLGYLLNPPFKKDLFFGM